MPLPSWDCDSLPRVAAGPAVSSCIDPPSWSSPRRTDGEPRTHRGWSAGFRERLRLVGLHDRVELGFHALGQRDRLVRREQLPGPLVRLRARVGTTLWPWSAITFSSRSFVVLTPVRSSTCRQRSCVVRSCSSVRTLNVLDRGNARIGSDIGSARVRVRARVARPGAPTVTAAREEYTPGGIGLCLREPGKGAPMNVDATELREVVNRLHRVQGQVDGLATMIEDGRDCRDVVRQFAARDPRARASGGPLPRGEPHRVPARRAVGRGRGVRPRGAAAPVPAAGLSLDGRPGPGCAVRPRDRRCARGHSAAGGRSWRCPRSCTAWACLCARRSPPRCWSWGSPRPARRPPTCARAPSGSARPPSSRRRASSARSRGHG